MDTRNLQIKNNLQNCSKLTFDRAPRRQLRSDPGAGTSVTVAGKATRIRVTLLALVLLPLGVVFSQGYSAPDITYRRDHIDISFTLPKPSLKEVLEIDGNKYVVVRLPGYGSTTTVGHPELPILDACVEISPVDPLPKVTIAECTWTELKLAAPVRPATEPVPKIPSAMERRALTVDGGAYKGRGFRNSYAEKSGSWYRVTPIRKCKRTYLELQFFLFSFDPEECILRYPCSFIASIGGTREPTTTTRSDAKPVGGTTPSREKVLIAAHDDLGEGAAAMVDYYLQSGYAAELLTVDGSPTPEELRSAIRAAYDEATFTYLLLVGDTDTVPSFDRGDHVSDMLYTLLDPGEGWDDFEGRDIILGRLPLRTNDDILLYRQKLEDFARSPRDQRFAWIAHGYNSRECGIAEGTNQWVIDSVIPETAYHAWFACSGGSAADLCHEINEGIHVLTYSGHGGRECWARWNFCTDSLGCLQNAGNPPIVISHACSTASFDVTTCLGEAWLLSRNRGVVFVGGSDVTYWDEDDWLQRAEFDALFSENPPSVGQALYAGLEEVARRSSLGRYYHEIYHILGDPALRLQGGLRLVAHGWTDGDNGIPEPGERGEFQLTLLNQRQQDLYNLTARIETEDPHISVDVDYRELENLAAGAEAVVAFPLHIAGSCPAGHGVSFSLTAAFEGGEEQLTVATTVHQITAVSGRVVFDEGQEAVEGVVVEVTGPESQSCTTEADGSFSLLLLEGTYRLRAKLSGYFPEERILTVPPSHGDILLSLGWAAGEVEPTAIRLTCLTDLEEEAVVAIHNPGTRPLSFRASFGGDARCENLGYTSCADLASEQVDWIQLRNPTVLHHGSADDEVWGPYPLRFAFPFYGHRFDEVYVCSNGFLTFSDPVTTYHNQAFPAAHAPRLLIAALWDDLVVNANGSVGMGWVDDGCVVEYSTISHFSGSPPFSFQIVLSEDGTITFRYASVPWSELTPTVGMQDASRTNGYTAILPTQADHVLGLCPVMVEQPLPGCGETYHALTPDDPDAPHAEWADMQNAVVVRQGWADDRVWGPYELAFPITFYRQEREELYISSNGFVTFTRLSSSFCVNRSLPSTRAPSAMIAPLWDDLVVNDNGSVLLLQDENRCVIEYRNVSHYGGSSAFSFQMQLLNDGVVTLLYSSVPWESLSPTVGLQDDTCSLGMTVPSSALTQDRVHLTRRPTWISTLPVEGKVQAGETALVTLTVSPDLDAEILSTTVLFRTNSPRQAVLELPLTAIIDEGARTYLRGDSNQDGRVNIGDVAHTARALYGLGSLPRCLDAADTDGDCRLDLADAVALLHYLFFGADAPPAPFPQCTRHTACMGCESSFCEED